MAERRAKPARRSMAAVTVLAVLLCLLPGCAGSAAVLRFDCDYSLDVRIGPQANSLSYSELATVLSRGDDSTSELYFTLCANRELGDDEQVEVLSLEDENGQTVRFQVLNGGALIHVTLNSPLAPGSETALRFQCRAALPKMKYTFGVARDGEIQLPSFHVQLAACGESGWDTDPPAENGDGRYGTVGDYFVRVTVPEGYQAACAGTETAAYTAGGMTTYCFEAEARRDLMLTVCADYMVLERMAGDTRIIGYFNTGLASREMAEQAMNAAAFALEYFSAVYTEYPCGTLIVANSGAGTPVSMEYSGFITVNMGDYVDAATVYHEVAHQWFYFLVGDDENEEAWLDESFATFSANLCLEAAGDTEAASRWWEFYREIAGRYPGVPLNAPSDAMDSYMDICYSRGAAFLKELMDTMGREAFLTALSDYCVQYSYQTATTRDFLDLLSRYTQADLGPLLDEYIAG